jgi:hypothetical protein
MAAECSRSAQDKVIAATMAGAAAVQGMLAASPALAATSEAVGELLTPDRI